MRCMWLALMLLACKRESATSERPPLHVAASSDAAMAVDAQAAAAAVDVDLLHSIPMRVAVSSVVANPKITPFDLVDGDPATAWNSKTGQLVGAWIAFRVPPSTHVKAVKLTAGFTSKGKDGDYFVQNPRIQRVAIWHDGVKLREHTLDIESRELQTVPIDATGGDYKVEVTAIVPGQRKSWRETCVSELQVIGRPPPGMAVTPGTEPEISVGSLDAEPLVPTGIELDEPPAFASVDAFCADFTKRKPAPCEPWNTKCEKQPEPNTCGGAPDAAPALPPLPAKWTGRWVMSHYGNSKRETCNLALTANSRTYVLEAVGGHDCGQPVRIGEHAPYGASRHEIRVGELLGDAGEPELLLVTTTVESPGAMASEGGGESLSEHLYLCVANKAGAPRCAKATIGGLDFKNVSQGGVGQDGYDQWHEQRWKRDYAVQGSVLELHAPKGKPASFELDVPSGRHRLRIAD